MEDAIPPTDDESASTARPERRDPENLKTWTGEERRRMLDKVRQFETLSETFRSIRQNRPPDREDSDDQPPIQTP